MPNAVGFVDNSVELAHYAMLRKIKDEVSALGMGWTVLRYVDNVANHELILEGEGLTGTERIFVGFRTYQDAGADYYNLVAQTATGYLAGETFDNQPNAVRSAFCAHNQRIDYWLSWNAQHIKVALKVGTPVYESAYVGKFLPYARPSQFPYPVVNVGTLNGTPATRFSDTSATHSFGYKGGSVRMQMRNLQGAWAQPLAQPWANTVIGGATRSPKPTGTNYPIFPVELYDTASNIYGALDGVFFIGGFDNIVENTLTIGGVTYVVIQDVFRTGFRDYYALRLDP